MEAYGLYYFLAILCFLDGWRDACARDYLFYSTPGSVAVQPGIYGGPVKYHRRHGRANTAYKSGFYCVDLKDSSFRSGLSVRAMAYDPISHQVIVQLDEMSDLLTSVITSSVCTERPLCGVTQVTNILSVAENTDQPQRAKLGPFAMWNSTIYFVARRYSINHKLRTGTHRMEIRRLKEDVSHAHHRSNVFTRHNPIDLDNDSELVGLVLEEVSHKVIVSLRETQKPTDTLHIIPKDDHLVFLLQVQNYTFDDEEMLVGYSMDLMSVTTSNMSLPQDLRGVRIHSEPLPDLYTWYSIHELGGISYKDGTLCWTATDRVLCAAWDLDGPLTNIHTILAPAAARAVCSGSKDIYSNITTGIAIAKVEHEITLYFGCHSAVLGHGGAGILKTHHRWKSSTIDPIMAGKDPVFAGSMFISSACSDESDVISDMESGPEAREVSSGTGHFRNGSRTNPPAETGAGPHPDPSEPEAREVPSDADPSEPEVRGVSSDANNFRFDMRFLSIVLTFIIFKEER